MSQKIVVPFGILFVLFALLIFSLLRPQSVQTRTAATAIPLTELPLTLAPIDNTNNNLPTGVPHLESTPSVVTDLSPSSLERDKMAIYIRHSNGAIEKVWLLPNMYEAYVQQLSASDLIVLIAPPEAIMGQHPPLSELSGTSEMETIPPGTPSPNPPTPSDNITPAATPFGYPPPATLVP